MAWSLKTDTGNLLQWSSTAISSTIKLHYEGSTMSDIVWLFPEDEHMAINWLNAYE